MTAPDESYVIEICTDCAQLAANGEMNEEGDALSRIEDGNHVHLACGPDCAESFSWSRCDGCGGPAGSRHLAIVQPI